MTPNDYYSYIPLTYSSIIKETFSYSRWKKYKDTQSNNAQQMHVFQTFFSKWDISINSLYSELRELCRRVRGDGGHEDNKN